MSTKLKLMGADVGHQRRPTPPPPAPRELLLLDRVNGIYQKLVTDGEGNRLLGAIPVGTAPITMAAAVLPERGGAAPAAASRWEVGPLRALVLPDSAILRSP